MTKKKRNASARDPAGLRVLPASRAPWAPWALWSAVALVPLLLFWARFPYFGDPVIDWGTEVYTAWRLAEGAVLYRDLGYLHGPLSPHLHAALFSLFGATRGTLLVFNFLVYLGVLWALGAHLRAFFPGRAVACLLVFVSLLVGFNQVTVGANYNFVAPYRYGLTHGFLLALLSLLAWRRALGAPGEGMGMGLGLGMGMGMGMGLGRGRAGVSAGKGAAGARKGGGRGAARRRAAAGPGQWYFGAAAGILAGLASLAKHEVFVALAFALLVSVIAMRVPARRVGELALGFALAVAAWIALCLARGAGAGEALSWYWFPYSLIFKEEFRALPIYSASAENVTLARAGYWLLVVGVAAALLCGLRAALSLAEAEAKRRRAPWLAWVPFGAGCAALAVVAALWPRLLTLSQELWAAAPALGAVALLETLKRGERAERDFGVVALAFAVGLSLKVFADISLGYAGFLLGLPCVLFLAWLVFLRFPRAAPKRFPVSPGRWAALAALVVGVPQALEANLATWAQQRQMGVTLTSPTGSFRYYPKRAELLGAVTAHLKGKHAGARTLTVLPEGSYLNFALGKPSPLYFMSLMPDQLLFIYGEEAVLKQMAAHPADVVVVLPRSTEEFGLGSFKEGYGARVYRWLEEEYALDPESPAGAEIWVKR